MAGSPEVFLFARVEWLLETAKLERQTYQGSRCGAREFVGLRYFRRGPACIIVRRCEAPPRRSLRRRSEDCRRPSQRRFRCLGFALIVPETSCMHLKIYARSPVPRFRATAIKIPSGRHARFRDFPCSCVAEWPFDEIGKCCPLHRPRRLRHGSFWAFAFVGSKRE